MYKYSHDEDSEISNNIDIICPHKVPNLSSTQFPISNSPIHLSPQKKYFSLEKEKLDKEDPPSTTLKKTLERGVNREH